MSMHESPMMTDQTPYTPSLDEGREIWAMPLDPEDFLHAEAVAQFDRFIAQVRAEAWDEGWMRGFADCDGGYERADNPYDREEETDD